MHALCPRWPQERAPLQAEAASRARLAHRGQRGGGLGEDPARTVSTRVPARALANPMAGRPNISESHSETRVLEYPFSTLYPIQTGLNLQARPALLGSWDTF